MGRLVRMAATVLVLGLLCAVPAQGADPNLLSNGSFEDGFAGGVGKGWTAFSNGGKCRAAWGADSWQPVVWDGQWAQLITIETAGDAGIEPDRYAGIYQTVDAVPGATYHLALHGMVRSSEGSPAASGYCYRVQWAIDYKGGTDWRALEPAAWQELSWYEWPLASTGYLESLGTDVKATSARMTLFVRAWKKWGTTNAKGAFDLDAISLVGKGASGPAPAPPAENLPQTGLPVLGPAGLLCLFTLAVAAAILRMRLARR